MNDELTVKNKKFPTVVCLCGSTRFSEAFQKANLDETLNGKNCFNCVTSNHHKL